MQNLAEEAIVERVASLKRRLRLYKASISIIFLMVVALAAVTLWLPSTRPAVFGTVRAHRVEVVDQAGAVRAVLAAEGLYDSTLRLYDRNGEIAVELDPSMLYIYDRRYQSNINLTPKGLSLHGGGEQKAWLSYGPDGTFLALFDQYGDLMAALRASYGVGYEFRKGYWRPLEGER